MRNDRNSNDDILVVRHEAHLHTTVLPSVHNFNTERFGLGFLRDVSVTLITEMSDWKRSIRDGRYIVMMILIIVGTHVASLDATARRSFYASLVGPRSFISENDSSTGEGLLFIEGDGETMTRSQCHADGTASQDHLAELRRTLSFMLLFCRTNTR
jgi:hypothetical protein